MKILFSEVIWLVFFLGGVQYVLKQKKQTFASGTKNLGNLLFGSNQYPISWYFQWENPFLAANTKGQSMEQEFAHLESSTSPITHQKNRITCNILLMTTRNPARNSPLEVGSCFPLFFTGFYRSVVAQYFFHQQYVYVYSFIYLYIISYIIILDFRLMTGAIFDKQILVKCAMV